MNEVLMLAWAGVAGLLLGGIFFGGLWWTVRKAVVMPRPAPWIIGSFALRTAIALGGFYLVGHGHWERLLLSLLGFVIARFIVTRLAQPPLEHPNAPIARARHAP